MNKVATILAIVTFCGGSAFAKTPEAPKAPASATEHKIDFRQVLYNLDKEPYTDCKHYTKDTAKCEEVYKVTLKDLALHALDAIEIPKDNPVIRNIAFGLQVKLTKEDELELNTDEQKVLVDAIMNLRAFLMPRGGSLPLYEVGEAIQLISPADLSVR